MPQRNTGAAVAARTLSSVMRDWTRRLALAGIDQAGGDVRRLLAGTLGISAADLLREPERCLTTPELELLRVNIERRRRREPVSRILGERDFYGRTFAISPATLDPRPDTETLIAAALEIVSQESWQSRPLRLLDFGTGSGCLLLTLLCELPHATGVGSDISEAALGTAAINAALLGVEERVSWQPADGLESIAGPFHILIANPPYVRTADIASLEPEVRNFDPIGALDGGPDGLEFYRRLVRSCARLVPAGWIVLEVGHDQADEVAALLTANEAGLGLAELRIHHDVAGKRRCVAAKTLS